MTLEKTKHKYMRSRFTEVGGVHIYAHLVQRVNAFAPVRLRHYIQNTPTNYSHDCHVFLTMATAGTSVTTKKSRVG